MNLEKCVMTVIIPAYQVEPYLERCLTSLRHQVLTAWCGVVTDDGSLDKTGVIADEFARRDQRLTIVHQPNRGVAIARNRGLERIDTPYFTFIDPDDWIEPEHFQRLYDLVLQRDDCIAVVNVMDHASDGKTVTRWHPVLSSGLHALSAPVIYKLGTLINKLFPTMLLGSLKFFEGLEFGEDIVFSVMIMSRARGGVVFDSEFCGYHYMRRPVSLAHGRTRLDGARRYWDDSLILYRHRSTLLSPSLFREWMFRSMSGHITSIFSLRDAFQLAKLFTGEEARCIWQVMWTVPCAPGDNQYYAGYRAQAGGYGLIFGWIPSVLLKAIAFWGWNWGWRLLSLGKRGVWRGWRRLWEGMSSSESLSK